MTHITGIIRLSTKQRCAKIIMKVMKATEHFTVSARSTGMNIENSCSASDRAVVTHMQPPPSADEDPMATKLRKRLSDLLTEVRKNAEGTMANTKS
jgi:hypothetical protein